LGKKQRQRLVFLRYKRHKILNKKHNIKQTIKPNKMKNYNEQLNEIGANVIKDLKKIKNKVLFKGNEENFWEHIYDLPQTYTLNKYEQRTTYFITELYEDNGELRVKAQDNEEGNEETFNIRQLSTETLIDILYFEPIENNQ
jgi:hypothetical protein